MAGVLGHTNVVTMDHAHGILRTNTVEIKMRSRFDPKTLQKDLYNIPLIWY